MTERSLEPTERMTRICAAMIQALNEHPEAGEDLRIVVMLSSSNETGALAIGGYKDDVDAIPDILHQLQTLAGTNGIATTVKFVNPENN